MRKSKHAPRNRKYAILYIVIIKVCSNTFILFVFFGIVRLANGKSPPPQKNWKNLRHLPLGVGDKISFLMWQKKGSDLCCPRYIPKISCRLGSLLSRVQKVYTCNYLLWGHIITQEWLTLSGQPPASLQLLLSQDQPISHNELDLSYNNSPQLW